MITKQGRTPAITPFDMSGVERSDDGVLRYTGLPQSLLHMFRDAVRADARIANASWFSAVSGSRISRSGTGRRGWPVGSRPAVCGEGDRVANRHGGSLDWCLGFWGTLMAGARRRYRSTRGSPTPRSQYVVSDSGAAVVLAPGAPLPDGEPLVVDDIEPGLRSPPSSTRAVRPGFPKGAMTSHANFLS